MFDTEGPLTGGLETWSFVLPADAWFKRQVLAALFMLTSVANWNEQPGAVDAVPIDGAVQAAEAMLASRGEGGAVIIGALVLYFYSASAPTLPAGTVACDGALLQRVDYPLLYEYLDSVDSELIVNDDEFNAPNLATTTVNFIGFGNVPAAYAMVSG